MIDGPIVIKVSIQRGDKKPYKARHTISEAFRSRNGYEQTREMAIANFARIWDLAHGLTSSESPKEDVDKLIREVKIRNSNLRLIKE